MKRFITLLALVIGLAATSYAVASVPSDKVDNHSDEMLASFVVLMPMRDMTPTMEVVPEWVAVLTDGDECSGFANDVFHPPATNFYMFGNKYLR